MKTTVSTKGQIILPAEIRQQDGIEPGQESEVERIDRGEYRLKRKPRDVVDLFRHYYGPTNRAFASLDDAGQQRLTRNFGRRTIAGRGDFTVVEAEYLEVIATRA